MAARKGILLIVKNVMYNKLAVRYRLEKWSTAEPNCYVKVKRTRGVCDHKTSLGSQGRGLRGGSDRGGFTFLEDCIGTANGIFAPPVFIKHGLHELYGILRK